MVEIENREQILHEVTSKISQFLIDAQLNVNIVERYDKYLTKQSIPDVLKYLSDKYSVTFPESYKKKFIINEVVDYILDERGIMLEPGDSAYFPFNHIIERCSVVRVIVTTTKIQKTTIYECNIGVGSPLVSVDEGKSYIRRSVESLIKLIRSKGV